MVDKDGKHYFLEVNPRVQVSARRRAAAQTRAAGQGREAGLSRGSSYTAPTRLPCTWPLWLCAILPRLPLCVCLSLPTRQVEHTITEELTGVDIVPSQIKIAGAEGSAHVQRRGKCQMRRKCSSAGGA